MTQSTNQPDSPDPLVPEAVMEDFVFGGIEADEAHLLLTERKRLSGLRHCYAITPRDPAPGEAVMVTVYSGPDIKIDRVSVYVTTDGSQPAGQRGNADSGFTVHLEPTTLRWEPLLWDYVQRWQGVLPPQPEGTFVQYVIEGWRSYDPSDGCWSSELQLDGTDHPTRYGYRVDNFALPTWAREAVVYEIFVDRFTGVENRWLEPAEMNRFTGGTLRGITDKLAYIVDLGVTAIWLSPIFITPTYHGYDTTDYAQVDPRFGTNEDLRTLVEAAHGYGLRVILDFVANHTSVDFAPFAQAQRDPTSLHRTWFNFGDTYEHGYRTFFNVASMPQLDTDQPAVRSFLIDAARYWLTEYNIDGYRLDYAAGPSHAFWSEFRAACRAVKPDCWLFGEVTLAGDDLRSYEGRLDGCLDFAFCRLIRQLCAHPQSTISLAHFANTLQKSRSFFKEFHLPSFIDNHDMNRFLWAAGNDKARLRLAAGLLFAFGDTPILYYGTEVGLGQPRGKGPWREEARHPMLWGESQDKSLLAYFQALIALRRRHPALTDGSLITHHLDVTTEIWLVERTWQQDNVLVAVNMGAETGVAPLPWPEAVESNGLVSRGTVTLPPCSITFFLAR